MTLVSGGMDAVVLVCKVTVCGKFRIRVACLVGVCSD